MSEMKMICCTGIISKYIEKYDDCFEVFQNFPLYILFYYLIL